MSVIASPRSGLPAFRTSPSAIARYFFHDCERFLRYLAASRETRDAEGLPTPDFDHSPVVKAILESGYAWEQTVLEQYLVGRVQIADGSGEIHTRRFDWRQTLQWLRQADPGSYLYQPTLRLPRAFYARHGLDPDLVIISDNHPDLLLMDDDGRGGRTVRVLDLKRGESLQLTHRVQVLLYALELESICWADSIRDLQVDLQRGDVWLGSHPAPTPFDMADLRPHVEAFLRHDLTRILQTAAQDTCWHVQPRCEWCEFFAHCRDQMQRDDDLSRMTQLTAHGKQYLHREAKVRTLAELERWLQRDEADEVLGRCASLAGRRPRLVQQVAALQSGQVRTHGAASPTLSKGENVGVFLTLQQEPLSQAVYLAGVHLTMRKDLRETVFSAELVERFFAGASGQPLVLVAGDPDDVPRIRREFVRTLYEIVTQLDRYNLERSWSDQLSLQAYVLSDAERALLVQWLLESLQDAEQPELAEQAVTLLFHFQSPELMVADSHPDREVPFPVVVLTDAMSHVLALPVDVSYTLPEALPALGSRFSYRRNDYYHFPLGHALRAEAIHAAWRRGKPEKLPELAKQAAFHLRALRELLQSVRQQAGDAIFAWAAKFTLPARQSYADPLLSRLAFFSRYESLLDCLDKRHWRCESHAVQLLLGRVMELRAVDETQFEIVAGAAMPVDPGGFPEWLLVAEGDEGRRAQLEYRDYACRARLWQGKPQTHLAVVGVTDLQRDPLGTPCRLTVEFAKPFANGKPVAGRRYLLYPRFTDFTTDGIVQFLQDYSSTVERLGEDELFLRLLRDPAAGAAPLPLPTLVAQAASLCNSTADPGWTPSQAAAFRAICNQRVVPVWGPPGTGKTHFLTTAILALAEAHRRAGRPFRVLVTAFTHAAIENVLRKTVDLMADRGRKGDGPLLPERPEGCCAQKGAVPFSANELESQLAVAKVKAWRGEHSGRVQVVEPKGLPAWLEQQPIAVVGATVHSLLKCYEQLPEFDLVVIDEASQVRVPEAAVPISLAGRSGRVVLAGDHLQLPPIVQGVYPDPLPGQPVLHRSIFEVVADARTGEDTGLAPSRPACQLTENFRMNDVLTSFAAGLLYGADYRPNDESVGKRRLDLIPQRCLDPFVEACLDPEFPLTVVVLDGIWAARENPLEARLVAQLVTGLRGTMRDGSGHLFDDDGRFFHEGVFLVSPHRAQIRLIESQLRQQRMWQTPPLVDTVDKMQGQEAEAVIVSYGVSDPEFAAQEAEFIYGLNRLNVAVTRARSKCVVFLPRTLLDASPQIFDQPQAVRGLAYMRDLVAAVAGCGSPLTFELEQGSQAVVYRANQCFQPAGAAAAADFEDDARQRELIDDSVEERPKKRRKKVDAASSSVAASVSPSNDAVSPATSPKPKRGRRKTVAAEVEASEQTAAIAAEATVDYATGGTAVPPATKRAAAADPNDAERTGVQRTAQGDGESDVVPELLARLNEPQRAAAMHGDDPLLIIAGAGTGKTTTLVHRVAYMISRGAAAHRMLLLTFTRRAAAEMLDRVANVLRQQDVRRNVWGGTFHGVGARLLRIHGPEIGIDGRFTIHDRGDAESLLATVCRELDLGKGDKKFPKKGTLMSIHSYMVNAGLSLDETLDRQFPGQKKYAEPIARLFAAYAEQKKQLRIFDYDDLLVKWCELLEDERTGPKVRDRFDHVLVDEYQDTNRLQSRLLKGLCPDGRGLSVVGDDAQSIYAFRAATIRNILDFPKDFPGTRTITLEQNYRSTCPILNASNRIIADASERFTKDLWSDRAAGSAPQLITCEDEHEQVEFVVARILDHRRQGVPLAHQAVLFRSAHHSIRLEAELARQGLAFVKYGGLKFVEAAHVKDLLAFLRLAENPRDRVSGQRVLNLLPGIGPKKADQLQQLLIGGDAGFEPWAKAKPPAAAADDWPQLVSLLGHLAKVGSNDPAGQIQSVLAFYQPILEGVYDNASLRMKDLEELQQLARRYEDRADLLSELALDPPEDDDVVNGGDHLVLSTMHSAKGLEWRAVYVLHATDGKIPHERSFMDPEQLEEERRMFYVAMTRAADWLYVCHPRREASGYGNSWMGNVFETTTLTRFITADAKRKFQCQTARNFRRPADDSDEPPAGKKPKRKPRVIR
ncbi:MAG: UvrD-helicase domain-containing protein [Pirellulaceae bacterium]|nr:UvrD-helicase domain-containing protein [Pirellulaceae bacterium]